MIRRLRWKFVGINMVLVAAMLAAICSVFLISIRDSLQRDSASVLQRVISERETPDWSEQSGDVSLPYFTVVVTPNGGASITSSQFYGLDDYDFLLSAVNAGFRQGERQGILKDYNLRYLRQAASDGWRMAFVDVSYEQSTLNRAILTVVLVGLGALAAFFGLSVLLARWAVGPVEQSLNQQRQFVADASHELKTPLTVILSNADLLAEQGEGHPEHIKRWSENIRTGGREMQELVEQMLLLARSDQEERQEQTFEPVDLSDLTESALLMFEPVAFEAGKTLTDCAVAPGVIVTGDASQLTRLLDILLDNAVKYAAPNGAISVTLETEGRNAVLSVTDQGTPIPEQELERIFDRFYRTDQARTTQGFGLGLAIARSIAQEHGGALRAESDPEGYNTFICTLPLDKG
ncbi:MAG: HAMP domain-containing histidine kinase [Oscillospiraceae bacterium]|nr:HAMP domain-containing histidine kinase [Oscillospiraceae bacterium]